MWNLYVEFPSDIPFIDKSNISYLQGDVWICMELMDKSLDKLCHLVYNRLGEVIPELMVGKMAEAVSEEFNQLVW